MHYGEIHIQPVILGSDELLVKEEELDYIDVNAKLHHRIIHADELAFTYCGTLFTYKRCPESSLKVTMENGTVIEPENLIINAELSAEIFARSGKVKEIFVCYPIR